jgi:putative sugar O-methyltransferase
MVERSDAGQAHAYQVYERVRDAVSAILASIAEGRSDATKPSRYWEEELDNFDYMLDASPRIVRKLRHHTFHVTGLRVYDYRSNQPQRQALFEQRYRALLELHGPGLRVPEAPEFGGFGYTIDGALYNLDTLKFWEALVAMDRAALLAPFRRAESRRLVWEIGAGWGGFPYQFKTLFPNVTYVITDLPELFLFSATYLASMFPGARWLIYRGEEDREALADWASCDFIFLPTSFSHLLPPAAPDLTVNMVSFQEMTTAQVREYAQKASAVRARGLYSLNRDRSLYNTELTSVRSVLSEYFDLTQILLFESDYTSAVSRGPHRLRTAPPPEADLGYRHVMARPRAAVEDSEGAGTRAAAVGRWPKSVDFSQVPVGIGLTAYNKSRHLAETLHSLQRQTFANFALVVVDDQSTDKTETIARRFAARDARIRYVRNPTRLGMIGAWRRAFGIVRKACPNARYFAWASDHDLWAPEWIATMLAEFAANPDLVLAYSLDQKISETGQPIDDVAPTTFETAGLRDLDARWRHLCEKLVGAGNMVYGLIRVDALERAGVFRNVLLPDRLLIAELTVQGQIRQVPRVLWQRRQIGSSSLARQRRTLFGSDRVTLRAYLPWHLVHAAMLVLRLRVSMSQGQRIGTWRAARLAGRYGWMQIILTLRKKKLGLLRRDLEDPTRPTARLRRVLSWWRDRDARRRSRLNRVLVPAVSDALRQELVRHTKALLGRIDQCNGAVAALQTQVTAVATQQTEELAGLRTLMSDHVRVEVSELIEQTLREDLPPVLETQLAEIRNGVRVQLNEVRKASLKAPPGSGAHALERDAAFAALARRVTESGRTMLGYERLHTLWQAVSNVQQMNLPAAEVGCYRGGSTYFLAGAFKLRLGHEAEIHTFDTFEGHPAALITRHDSHLAGMFGDVSEDDVRQYLSEFTRVCVHKGEFSEMAPGLPERTYALVHVDTDLYLATLGALEYFGPRLAPGGLLVVDDYAAPKCPGVARATTEFLTNSRGFTAWQLPIEQLLLVRR